MASTDPSHDLVRAFDFAQHQVRGLVARDPGFFPMYTRAGRWRHAGESWTDWCGGFLAGMMWFFHRVTGSTWWRNQAETYSRLLEPRKNDRNVHDLGFIFLNSYRRWFEASGDRSRMDIVAEAGVTLAGRFQEKGQYLASFLGAHSLFIDVMMNMPLLYVAAEWLERRIDEGGHPSPGHPSPPTPLPSQTSGEGGQVKTTALPSQMTGKGRDVVVTAGTSQTTGEGGDVATPHPSQARGEGSGVRGGPVADLTASDPLAAAAELRHIATTHCLTSQKYLVRNDGSTAHEAIFDVATGEFLRQSTQQGLHADSCWSRGLAWALYGFGTAFGHTRDPQFLQTACRCADYFLAHLPADRIPPWDFDVPEGPDRIYDTSAAAIAASGLLQLAELVDQTGDTARHYREAALGILHVLCSDQFLAISTPGWEGILLHAVYHVHKKLGVDESVMWGDHFFVEALVRAAGELSMSNC